MSGDTNARQGAGKNEGQDYEYKLATYLFVKAGLDEDLDDFKLISNIAGVGSADDVIFAIGPCLYLIQLKWYLNTGDVISRNTLMKSKNKISLSKESKSYSEVKSYLAKPKSLFETYKIENCNFIIFTNGKHSRNMKYEPLENMESPLYFTFDNPNSQVFKFKKRTDESDEELGKILNSTEMENCSIYKQLCVLESGQEFCDQLIMCTGQPGPVAIMMETKKLIKNKIPNSDVDKVYCNIETKLKNELKKGKSCITRARFNVMFTEEIIRVKHLELIKTNMKFKQTIIDELEKKILKNSKINFYSENDYLLLTNKVKSICNKSEHDSSYKFQNIVYFRWTNQYEMDYLRNFVIANPFKTLILEESSLNILDEIHSFSTNPLVVLTRKKLDFDWHKEEVKTTLEEIIELPIDLSERLIKFQGHDVKLGDVVDVSNCNLDGHLLQQLVFDTNVVLGHENPESVCHYLDRKLEADETIVKNVETLIDQHFIYITNSKYILEGIETSRETICNQEVHVYRNLRFTDRYSRGLVQELTRTLGKNLHWFEEDANGSLNWRKSFGEPLEKPSEKIEYKDDLFDIPSRLIILFGEAGCGKSTTLSHWALVSKKLDKNRLVLLVKLKDYYDYLQLNSFTTLFDVVKFLTIVFDRQKDRSCVIDYCLANNRTVILLDGLDEVAPDYLGKIEAIVDLLLEQTNVGKICVTSRPNVKWNQQFIHYRFKMFTSGETINVLTKFLREIRPNDLVDQFAIYLLRKLKKTFNCKYVNLLNNILHIRLVAYNFSDEFDNFVHNREVLIPETADLLNLVETFVNKKIEKYIEHNLTISRANPDFESSIKEKFEYIKNNYVHFGLSAMNLNLENVQSFDADILNEIGLDRVGLITYFIGNRPHFSHKLFPEYLSALYFRKNFNQRSEFIKTMFVKPEMKVVKYLFDLMLAETVPIFKNVICKKFDVITELNCEVISVRDVGGRNILHLAVDYKNISSITHVLRSPKREELLSMRDDLFSWTPLMYTTWRKNNWTVIKTLCENGALLDYNKMYEDNVEFDNLIYNSIREDNLIVFDCLMKRKRMFVFQYRISTKTLTALNILANDAVKLSVLDIASGFGSVKIMNRLLEFPKYFDLVKSLHIAVCNNQSQSVENLLQHKVDINSKYDGYTTVYEAVFYNHLTMLEYLIDNGADVNLCTSEDMIPLHLAINSEYTDITRLLVTKRAALDSVFKNERVFNGALKLPFCRQLFMAMSEQYVRRNLKLYLPLVSLGFFPLHLVEDINMRDGRTNTLLMNAVEYGNQQLFLTILDEHRRVDIHLLNDKQESVLTIAARMNNLEFVSDLLQRGAKANVTWKSKEPLHWAVEHKNHDMVLMLLEHGADVNGNLHKTPLMYAVEMTGNDLIVSTLLKNQADVNLTRDDVTAFHTLYYFDLLLPYISDLDARDSTSGDTPLMRAVKKYDCNIVQKLLGKQVNIEIRDNKGFTPMLMACKLDQTKSAMLLLEARASIKVYVDGKCSLYYALLNNNQNLVINLLQNGIEIDLVLKCKILNDKLSLYVPLVEEEAVQVSTGNVQLDQNSNPETEDLNERLLTAACSNDLDLLNCLVLSGVDLYFKNKKNETALMLAAKANYEQFVEQILLHNREGIDFQDETDHGAEVSVQNQYGQTPIVLSTQMRSTEAFDLLLKKVSCMADKDSWGWTILHYISCKDRVTQVRRVIEKGGDIHETTYKGKTALDLAVEHSCEKVVAFFLEFRFSSAELRRALKHAIKGHSKFLQVCLTEVCEREDPHNLALVNLEDLGADVLSEILQTKPVDIEVKDKNGDTVLHRSAHKGLVDCIKVLLENKANPNSQNKKKRTPLMLAVMNFKLPAVETLLTRDIDINVTDYSGCTALGITQKWNKNTRRLNRRIIELIENEQRRIDRESKKKLKKSGRR